MEVVVRPRRAGKTNELIEWVKQGEKRRAYPFWTRIILTYSMQEAERLRKTPAFGLDYHQVFSAKEWRNRYRGTKPLEVGVDNADILLRMFVDENITRVTMTGEVK